MSGEARTGIGAGIRALGDGRPPVQVLVVDEDAVTRGAIIRYLDEHGVQAIAASTPQDIARCLAEDEPDLVVLDLLLGQEDGFDLLRSIRSASDVPVIVTTGYRRDEIDRVVGLELGADDYLTKPFGLRELLARIRAVLRRGDPGRTLTPRDGAAARYWLGDLMPDQPAMPQPDEVGRRIGFGGWQLDRHTRRLTNRAGRLVPLTKGEYALLAAFLDAPQQPLSREHLLQATRMRDDMFGRTIDVQVLRLRRKLETDPGGPRVIQTERGVGYKFALPVEQL
jgi:DNA-binding response OmpR family regulator